MGECFQRVRYYLDRGMDVFFTGTPCQVDGLYRFLGESPERLLTADVLCSGVPSPGVWSKTVEAMHYIKQRRVKTVQFCKKPQARIPVSWWILRAEASMMRR